MFNILLAAVLGQTCPQCPPRVVTSVPTYARQTTYAALEPVAAINAARGQYGRVALVSDAKLNQIAAERAVEYAAAAEAARLRGEARHGMRFHRWADGRVAVHAKGGASLAECLCWGTGSMATVPWAVSAWNQSPTHAPILHGNFSRVGVGTAYGPDGTLYTAAVFQ